MFFSFLGLDDWKLHVIYAMSSGYALILVSLLVISMVKIIKKLRIMWRQYKQNRIPTVIQLREMQGNLQAQVPAQIQEEAAEYQELD